jgi:hypothetical protein
VTEAVEWLCNQKCAVQGEIASRSETWVGNPKIGMEKYKLVVNKLEICAKAHEIGAIEANLRSP